MRMHHARARWVNGVLLALGAWLATSPGAIGHRSAAMRWNDVACGVAVMALAAIALRVRGVWPGYATSAIGVWLLVAPVALWAPTAAESLNDTLLGALLVVFAVLVPHGMAMEGPDVPAGWSYDPSSWPQRAPVIALGLVGFFLSRAMAAYQLGHVSSVWDPFFGDGTVRILRSEVSRTFPVSDAGLGSVAYLVEVLMGFMGDGRRWRTMPWMVTFFGLLVVPLGVVSIVLVILQPVAVGAWCGPCLVAAAAMLVMIPLTLDEVVAMLQYLARARREGRSTWRTFWRGGAALGEPAAAGEARWSARAMARGVTVPWGLAVATAAGAWIMAAPALLGTAGAAAHSDHLAGALVITTSVIATAEVARPVRLLNVALGAWLVAAPFLLGAPGAAAASDVLAGLIVAAASVPLGAVRERYGAFGRRAFWAPLRHREA